MGSQAQPQESLSPCHRYRFKQASVPPSLEPIPSASCDTAPPIKNGPNHKNHQNRWMTQKVGGTN
jgi:hypothetical protein